MDAPVTKDATTSTTTSPYASSEKPYYFTMLRRRTRPTRHGLREFGLVDAHNVTSTMLLQALQCTALERSDD